MKPIFAGALESLYVMTAVMGFGLAAAAWFRAAG